MTEKRGKFIVFEGLDGCGKSTQLEYLRERLSDRCKRAGNQRKVFATREPSDSIAGLICRGISKKTIFVQPETECLLFAADRYEHIVTEILPQIKAGNHVLCDRFFLSSFAYQSSYIDIKRVLEYNLAAMNLIKPDITIFINLSPEECAMRRTLERPTEEKYETVKQAEIILKQYAKAIEFLKDKMNKVLSINGSGKQTAVFNELWDALLSHRVFEKEDFA
ncbi:MAG: dTMP kinase [Clostridiales bacterium]|nr:dTMP kinase [Clostridiales bacterium]